MLTKLFLIIAALFSSSDRATETPNTTTEITQTERIPNPGTNAIIIIETVDIYPDRKK